MSFRLQRHASTIKVDLDADGATICVVDGPPVPVRVGDEVVAVEAGRSIEIKRS